MVKLIKNILLSLASIVITLLICEGIARFLLPPAKDVDVDFTSRQASSEAIKTVEDNRGSIDSVMDWSGQNGIRLFPNVSAKIHNHTLSHQDVSIDTNSLGLRNRELSTDKKDELRILAIGDSITFGDYVSVDETIPGLVEKKLKSKFPQIVVINAGLPGANTKDEFHHYLELADAVQPDVVLVGMYLNDSQNSEQFYAKKLAFPYSKSRLLSFVAERLQILKMQSSVKNSNIDPEWREKFAAGRALQTGDMLRSRDGFDYEIYNAHTDFGLAWNEQSWKNLEEITDTFARAVTQRKSKFLLYFLPIHAQVYGDEKAVSFYPQEKFKEMCNKLGLTCLDTLPALRAATATMPMKEMFYDHCHYRTAGNEIVASTLAAWLDKELP